MFEVEQDLGASRPPFNGALFPDARDVPLHVSKARTGHKRWFVLKFAITVFVALTGAAAFNILTGTPAMHMFAGSGLSLDRLARWTGFGIDTIALTGHKFTADTDIYDALDLANARSLATFDTNGVRQRLERLPWIESAEITRVYPDRLDVKVTERKAFAIWRRGADTVLIDHRGRVLTAVHRTDGLGLPTIVGDGAATAAEALFSVLAGHLEIANKLTFAERVGGRRWTLHLDQAVTVHLPADGEVASLTQIAEGGRYAALIAKGNTIIDLRAQGRTAVRPQTIGRGES